MNSSSVSSHLIELRSRLIKTLICMGALTIIGLPFASEIYSFVASPLMSVLPSGSSMIATGVSSPFMAPIKLTLFVALLLSMPYFFYQMWLFMSPGLYKNEKSLVLPLMTSTIFLFITGVAFAYYVVCPIIFGFFINSAPDSIVVMTDISQYLNFVLRVTFAFGVAFEMPVATYLIIRSGIARKEKLKKARPYLIVLFFILGMLLTPPDVFSQLFLAIPMWLLFELGLLISKDRN
jgi:sec-independent protein translocase protein TatC